MPEFPASFPTIDAAQQFCSEFFYQYNYVHGHSGIGWHTPASVHHGTADVIDAQRQNTLDTAYQAHPTRFRRPPRPPTRPAQVWINEPIPEPK